MIDKILPLGSTRRNVAKKAVKPFSGILFKVLKVKILGKQVFINRYTRKIPVIGELLHYYDIRLINKHIGHLRQYEYSEWIKTNSPSQKELEEQRIIEKDFKQKPKISILVPTYNTKPEFLKQCIDSVEKQTYSNWQLCIADDASSNKEVREIIQKYADKDNRIKYVLREDNGHICYASNSALELADGDFIALLDHDDILWPNALFEVVKLINENQAAEFIYTDEDKVDEKGKYHGEPFLKPEWSPEYLRSVNYITHFAVIKKDLIDKVGGFRPGYEGAQDWDLFLRVSRETDEIHHIPKILYSWRKSDTSTAQDASAKNYAYESQKKALEDDVKQRGFKADIEWEVPYLMWRIKYKLKAKPKVSIIIPTKDSFDYISNCLKSIHDNTHYKNYEIIIADTGTEDNQVWGLYEKYKQTFTNLKIIKWKKKFNFAAVCNFGAKHAKGDYFLFLNNDTQVITNGWIENFLEYSQMEDIGAIGCRLLYPIENRLQHAGVILGVGGKNETPGIAGHFFPAYIDSPPQDPVQPLYIGGVRNFSAVTAACLMVEKEKFEEVEGFDPEFEIAFNDVDFCLKLLDKGWRNVYLPHVTLMHHESISVGKPGSKQRDIKVFGKEINLMLNKWPDLIKDDPYYHPEFRRDVANARLNVNLKED